MKKIAILLCAIILYIQIYTIKANALPFAPSFAISSEAAVLINLDKDITVYEKNPTKKMYPASLTKLVTAMVVFDNVKDIYNTSFEAPLVVFDELYGMGASSVGYSRDEVITVSDLMYSMLMYSACESAGILAYNVGGKSIPNFVDMMNNKAAEIGCTGTHFTNSHGLFDENQYTNARDMALIVKYAVKNYQKLIEIASTTEYTLHATNFHEDAWLTIYHTNKMLVKGSDYYYKYAKGLKTGTLDESGRNLATLGSCDGNNYLLVTLGSPIYNADGEQQYLHYEDHQKLYDWAFNTFSFEKIVNSADAVTEIPVKMGQDQDYVLVVPSEDYQTLWPNTLDISSLKIDINTKDYLDEDGSITAPVEKGQKLGTYTCSLSGEVICSVDLIAKDSVELSQLDYTIMKAKAFIGSFWFKLAVIIALILIILYIILYISVSRKRHRKLKKVTKKRNF